MTEEEKRIWALNVDALAENFRQPVPCPPHLFTTNECYKALLISDLGYSEAEAQKHIDNLPKEE